MKRSAIFLLVFSCFLFNVSQAQVANCNALWSSTATGTIVNFQDLSTAASAITNWTWNFGDGSYSNLQNPVHAYTSQGNYGVTLTITTSLGCSDSYYDTLVVSGACSTSCQAAFSHVENGSTVNFTDSSTATGNITGWYWDFGDGSFSYSQHPNHAYAASGVYEACLTIYTDDSCSSTVCDSFFVQCASQCGPASFTYNITGNTVSFTNTSSGTYASSGWIFGGNLPGSSQTNPTVTYPGPGSYYVCLCIYDANGNLCDIVCETITIGNGCNAAAAFTYTVSGNTATFSNNSTFPSGGYSYWYFSDGGTSYQTNPTHTFPGPGTYYACLTIQDSINPSCYDSICQPVVIPGVQLNCQADFLAIDSGNNVIFIDQSTSNGQIVSYYWNFGDGSTSFQQNPTHFYTSPGIYGPCLTITSILGADTCTSTHCDTVVVGNTQCGPASFTYTVNGNTVSFTNTSQGTYASSGWTFGGGLPSSTLTNPTVTYNGPGTYNVCLCIYDANGNLCDIVCDTVVIGSGCNANASFTYTVSGNTVTFNNTSTYPPTGYTYWYFSDGSVSYQTNPTHTFPGPGTYFACLTIQDSINPSCYDSICAPVVIQGTQLNCQADFYAIDSGNTVIFLDQSSTNGVITSYFWNFGDGGTSTQANPAHFYSNPGTYYPCLYITTYLNGDTCNSSYCDTVTVGPGPCNANAAFTYSVVGSTVSFTNNSTLPSTGYYYWWFSDGSQSYQWNPVHTFNGPGNYYACLFVYDSLNWNCYDSTCASISISQRQGGILTQVPIWELGFKSVNPVADYAEISFDMEEAADLRIGVYDLSGKEIKVITDGNCSEGHHEMEWRADDLSAGMYFYRIQIGDYIQTEKFIKLH